MKVFAGVRLTIWAVILGACLAIVGLYWSASETILSQKELTSWTKKSDFYQVVRDDMIAPRLVSGIKNVQPNGFNLLPEKAIHQTLDQTVKPSDLESKSTPAIASLQKWLDSKSSDIEFSIDATSIRKKLVANLSHEIDQEIAALPACTYKNSLTDIQNAVCAYSPEFSSEIKSTIMTAFEQNDTLGFTNTITQNDITLPANVASAGRNLPDELNLLYMVTLFCGGVAILGALWLLIKKRALGIATLGVAGLIAACVLFITSGVLPATVKNLGLGSFAGVASTAADAVAANLNQHALLFAIIGGILLIIGSGITFFLQRSKQPSSHNVHFGKPTKNTAS